MNQQKLNKYVKRKIKKLKRKIKKLKKLYINIPDPKCADCKGSGFYYNKYYGQDMKCPMCDRTP